MMAQSVRKGLTMKENIMQPFTCFLKHMPFLNQIGCAEMTEKNIVSLFNKTIASFPDSNCPEEYHEISGADEAVAILSPFLKKTDDGLYSVNMEYLRTMLAEFYQAFLPGLLSQNALKKYISDHFKNYTFIALEAVENSDHQNYQYLYTELGKKYNELREEFYEQKYELDNAHRDLADLHMEYKRLQENSGDMKNSAMDIVEFINNFLRKEIVIQNIEVYKANEEKIICNSDIREQVEIELADRPGIYDFKRPSWFSPMRNELELNKKNVAKKTSKNTFAIICEKVAFWSDPSLKKMNTQKKASLVDEKRKSDIEKLLKSNACNEEKYIKYILLTPGMTKEYMKTLNGAAELGLDANTVIRLLEQPAENFNKEMLEAYVSEVHKATEYNLKQELANELICGKWYISSDINGIKQKYQLVPMEEIMEIVNRLEQISKVFEEYESIASASCHDGTKSYQNISEEKATSGLKEKMEYSDEDIFMEPDYLREDDYDSEEIEALFVHQIENEFMDSENNG